MKKFIIIIWFVSIAKAHAAEVTVDLEHYAALLSAVKASSSLHANSIVKSESAPDIALFTAFSYNLVLYVSTQLEETPKLKIRPANICELKRHLELVKDVYQTHVQSYDENERFVVDHAFQNADAAIDGVRLDCSEILGEEKSWGSKLKDHKNRLMRD